MWLLITASESQHPEYSGRVTHQIGAVQEAARENSSHTYQHCSPQVACKKLLWEHCTLVANMCITAVLKTGLHHHLVDSTETATWLHWKVRIELMNKLILFLLSIKKCHFDIALVDMLLSINILDLWYNWMSKSLWRADVQKDLQLKPFSIF